MRISLPLPHLFLFTYPFSESCSYFHPYFTCPLLVSNGPILHLFLHLISYDGLPYCTSFHSSNLRPNELSRNFPALPLPLPFTPPPGIQLNLPPCYPAICPPATLPSCYPLLPLSLLLLLATLPTCPFSLLPLYLFPRLPLLAILPTCS